MDYGAVLKRAWDITWKYKGLWVLGILASCSGGGGGGGGGGGQSGAGYRFGGRDMTQFQRMWQSIPQDTLVLIVVGLVLLILVLALIFLVLGVIGQGGLIAGFQSADEGNDVSLGEAFQMGVKHFWRLLGVRIVFWLAGLIVGLLVAMAVVLFAIGTMGIGLVCLLPLICLLIPVGLAVGVYVMLTQVALVVEDLGVFDAFRRSWEVFKAHLGPIVVIALIMILGGGLVGLVLAVPFIAVVLPVVTGLAMGTQRAANTGLILAGACFVIYLPILIVLNGVLQTYIGGVWTLTYRRLTGKAGSPAPIATPRAAPEPSGS